MTTVSVERGRWLHGLPLRKHLYDFNSILSKQLENHNSCCCRTLNIAWSEAAVQDAGVQSQHVDAIFLTAHANEP